MLHATLDPRHANAKFKAYSEGFTGWFVTLADLRVWANELNAKHNLSGCELKIWQIERALVVDSKTVIFD